MAACFAFLFPPPTQFASQTPLSASSFPQHAAPCRSSFEPVYLAEAFEAGLLRLPSSSARAPPRASLLGLVPCWTGAVVPMQYEQPARGKLKMLV